MNDKEYKNEIDRLYQDYDNYITNIRLDFYKQLSAALLTYSSAALALSIAMIKVLNHDGQIEAEVLLPIIWGAFGSSILSTLASFLMAIFALNKQSEYAERYYKLEDDSYIDKRNPWNKPRVFSIYYSSFAFAVGIVSTVVFAFLNI